MKTLVQIILVLTLFSSCKQRTKPKQNENGLKTKKSVQAELKSTKDVNNRISEKKIGLKLFESILDTIEIKPITKEFLKNNKWIYKPFDNCKSFMKFQENGKGIGYNCETEGEYELTYKIENNKVLVSEYDIPDTDNEKGRKIKYRDDTYVYSEQSLIMINSKLYNAAGLESTPEIKAVIDYKKTKH